MPKPQTKRARVSNWVTQETTGGMLLLAAAAIGLLWANSPWRGAYADFAQFRLGPEALHLDLTLATWAADGLLAIFFLTVGLELKHEIVAGSLRQPREAAVPVLAAVGGMIVPAVFYIVTLLVLDDPAALHGWAIPTATDIAFALAVLAIFGRGLPRALRTFLLTLAVVDDLLAIVVIAIAYTSSINVVMLLVSLACVVVFALAARAKKLRWWLLWPIGIVAWVCMHESGVHATIAGVLLGLSVPARVVHGETGSRTHRLDDRIRPWSAGLALPIFAFFAAGVTLVDDGGPGAVLMQPVVLAIVLGLVVGKVVGVLGVTALITKVTPLRLPDAIGIRDLLPVGLLTGIGFTVSLLIAELSFEDGPHTAGGRIAVLIGTAIAAVLAAGLLRWDARQARKADMNEDGRDDVNTAPIDDEDRSPLSNT